MKKFLIFRPHSSVFHFLICTGIFVSSAKLYFMLQFFGIKHFCCQNSHINKFRVHRKKGVHHSVCILSGRNEYVINFMRTSINCLNDYKLPT